LRSGRPVAFVVVLVWFYVLLAIIVNPSYSLPPIPTNPIMPFLTADTVGYLWPLVLISSPFVMLAAQKLIRPTSRTRQVTTQQIARVQARAHATRELIREDVRQSGSRASRAPHAEPSPEERVEPTPPLISDERKLVAAEELLRPVPKAGEPEFTPPPTTERDRQLKKVEEAERVSRETEKPSLLDLPEDFSREEKESDAAKRIEELEAERAAMASLMDRLEDMHKMQAIQPELYDKLKKKYVSELEKINAKVERLPVNEELKKKTAKKPTQI
jgi:hypothetical protein